MFHEILIPTLVAICPCIGLIVSSKFQAGGHSKEKVDERINKLEEQINNNQLKLERILGRLNGLDRVGEDESETKR